jgi:hypothetical protein
MAEPEVVHVAVVPPPTLQEDLVRNVAAAIGKNLYETRLRLTGKIPKIIANYDNRQVAESTAGNLRQLGLRVIVCNDSELRKSSPRYKAHTLKFEEQSVIFWDRSGQERRIEAVEMFLILSGRMQTEVQTEVAKTVRKLNVTATLLTGGIPITKKVKEKSTRISFQNESFIRLYNRMTPEPLVEILPRDFDYSFLGAEMASSAAANFSIVIRKIREAFPHAVYDDRLMEIHSITTQENIDANCKLIYWYHQAVHNIGTSLQLQA